MTAACKMTGKRVLVTGSGTGIGKGVAIEFAKAGASVALHYSRSSAGAEEAVKEITGFGGTAKAFQANFEKVDEVKQLGRQAVDFFGGLDCLVNNAGITTNIPFEDVTQEQFDLLYHVNIRGQFFLTQQVLPELQQSEGAAVINFTSLHAFAGMTEHAVYAGTKGAIVAYTRELSLELIQKGVRVNAIAPGWVDVENQHTVMGEDFDWEAGARTVPAGFIGTPRDMGRLCIFLASEDSRYIVGQTILADGGQSCIMPLTGDFREKRDYTFGQGYVPGLKT
jgi:NAD(P)-dependent dehydrogenase (short-subunit alcohol dehydrogenase family)